jgi:16S rRNA processing protein RimM
MAGGADRRWLTVGRIQGLFGVGGGLRVYSYLEEPADILDFDALWLDRADETGPRTVTGRARKGPRLILWLAGVGGRDQARELLGTDLLAPREAFPEPEEDAFYWADLEGMAVVTTDGVDLGEVDTLMETGANDVLVVAGADRERLLPFIGQVVREVDLEAGRMVVDWDPAF